MCVWESLHFIPAVAKIYPFRIPLGHSVHQKCFTAPAKIHFPCKEERAVWPVHVNTAVCAWIKQAERRESLHVIGLCRERRWIGVTGKAGHQGKRALSCPLQSFKDNKPQPPHRVDINSLYSYMCTRPIRHNQNVVTRLSHMKHPPR